MRRIFALLLLTPLLANCADSATPVASAPADAVLSEGDTEGEWFTEENWLTPGDALALAEDEMSVLAAGSPGAPTSATMVLGNPGAGTPYPPAQHDESYHARDRMIPGTVNIPVGGTVKFEVLPGHRMAIYDDGVMPDDIPLTGTGVGINYPVNRLFLQPNPLHPTLRFTRPGKYLVICVIKTHFFKGRMWGWVIVH